MKYTFVRTLLACVAASFATASLEAVTPAAVASPMADLPAPVSEWTTSAEVLPFRVMHDTAAFEAAIRTELAQVADTDLDGVYAGYIDIVDGSVVAFELLRLNEGDNQQQMIDHKRRLTVDVAMTRHPSYPYGRRYDISGKVQLIRPGANGLSHESSISTRIAIGDGVVSAPAAQAGAQAEAGPQIGGKLYVTGALRKLETNAKGKTEDLFGFFFLLTDPAPETAAQDTASSQQESALAGN